MLKKYLRSTNSNRLHLVSGYILSAVCFTSIKYIYKKKIALLFPVYKQDWVKSFLYIWPGLIERPFCTQTLCGNNVYYSRNYINLTYWIWLSHPSFSVARLPVDKSVLASIMTHDYAKDLCASKLDPLRIYAL